MHLNSSLRKLLPAVAVGLIITACNPFRINPITQESVFPAALQRAKKDKEYMVFHSGVDVYAVKYVEVERARQQFTVLLDRIDSTQKANYAHFLSRPAAGNSPAGVRQVHVFTKDSTSYTLDEPHTIPFSNIARIERIR